MPSHYLSKDGRCEWCEANGRHDSTGTYIVKTPRLNHFRICKRCFELDIFKGSEILEPKLSVSIPTLAAANYPYIEIGPTDRTRFPWEVDHGKESEGSES